MQCCSDAVSPAFVPHLPVHCAVASSHHACVQVMCIVKIMLQSQHSTRQYALLDVYCCSSCRRRWTGRRTLRRPSSRSLAKASMSSSAAACRCKSLALSMPRRQSVLWPLVAPTRLQALTQPLRISSQRCRSTTSRAAARHLLRRRAIT